MKFSEFFKLVGRYVKNPSQIGAVCPSSRFLARKMAECASGRLGASGVVAELGAGTGAVTRRLVETGCADSPRGLYSIEFDAVLAGLLRESFPAVKVVNGSAENLRAILGDDLPRLAAVISSLPLLASQTGREKNSRRGRVRASLGRSFCAVYLQSCALALRIGL